MEEKLKKQLTRVPTTLNDLSFMTELNKSKDGILNDRILEYQTAINQQLCDLDKDLDMVLTRHEQDFLNAFKLQLYKLHSQISELKKAANTTEIFVKHQEETTKLQESIEYHKKEAFKFEHLLEDYKKELSLLKIKNIDLEKECKHLENKLKSAKRKIKAKLKDDKPDSLDSTEKPEQSNLERIESKKPSFVPVCKSGETLLEILNASAKIDTNFLKNIESLMEKQARHFEEASKHLKTVILSERKKFQNYSEVSTSFFSQKHDLESIFLECVEEVKRDVNHRRAQSLNMQKYPTKTLKMPKETDQFFTPADKRKIIELLINNDKVLIMLYEALFPFRASNFQAKKKEPIQKWTKSQEELPPLIPMHSKHNSQSIPKH